LVIIDVDLSVIDKLLIKYCVHQTLEKKWEYNWTIHQLFQEGVSLSEDQVLEWGSVFS